MRWWSVLLLWGCPYVGDTGFQTRVEDVDGDGVISRRFGGRDCDDADSTVGDCDKDGDGFESSASGGSDCDDSSALINPDAQEQCDGVDNNCDGFTDDLDPTVSGQQAFYLDGDGDGVGTDALSVVQCEAPAGYVPLTGDCDDGDALTRPGFTETCDPVDRNCDGDLYAGATILTEWFEDRDGDGLGGTSTGRGCVPPHPHDVDNSTDCDDTNAAVLGLSPWFTDLDGDGFGTGSPTSACAAPPHSAAQAGDCDDSDPERSPGALERCDGIDNNCSGLTDDDDPAVIERPSWYGDNDGDGYVRYADRVLSCLPPSGYRADPGTAEDCNDANADANPGASEVCDNLDNDCDGLTDIEDSDIQSSWYVDADGDGYGDDSTAVQSCTPIADRVQTGGDCVDFNAAIHPFTVWYADADEDGVGVETTQTTTCDPPATQTWSLRSGDCDDTNPLIHPGSTEICTPTGIDDDCNGLTDDDDPGLTGGVPYSFDLDNDGYGDPNDTTHPPSSFCSPPPQWVPLGAPADCGPLDPSIHPDADEHWYDGIDQNCDGEDDNDQDGDGYPLPSDCNDTDPSIHPGAEDAWYDNIDSNCDGANDYDQDGDGFVAWLPPEFPTPAPIDPQCAHCADNPEDCSLACQLDCDDRALEGFDKQPRDLRFPDDLPTLPAACLPSDPNAPLSLQQIIQCSCNLRVHVDEPLKINEPLRVAGNALHLIGPHNPNEALPNQADPDYHAVHAFRQDPAQNCNIRHLCLTYEPEGSAPNRPSLRVSSAPHPVYTEHSKNGRVVLENLVMFGGKSNAGGALRVDEAQQAATSQVWFYNNLAFAGGGGVYLDEDSALVATDTTFLGNLSVGEGAAIYGSPGSSITLDNSLLSTNVGARSSGIYLDQTQAIQLESVLFQDNGVRSIAGSPAGDGVFAHNTFFSNNSPTGVPVIDLWVFSAEVHFDTTGIEAPDTLISAAGPTRCSSCVLHQTQTQGVFPAQIATFSETYTVFDHAVIIGLDAQVGLQFLGGAGAVRNTYIATNGTEVFSDAPSDSLFGVQVAYTALLDSTPTHPNTNINGGAFFIPPQNDQTSSCFSPSQCVDAHPGGPTTNFTVTATDPATPYDFFVNASADTSVLSWDLRLSDPTNNPLMGHGQGGSDIGIEP